MRRLERKPRARADIKSIRERSRRVFGPGAQQAYGKLMKRAFELLCADPQRAGVKRNDDLLGGVHLFHLRHARTRGVAPKQPRHIVVFTYDDATLTVLRVLHDSMDIAQHMAEGESEA